MTIEAPHKPTDWPYVGPMIANGHITVPEPKPLCVNCPAAWWYQAGNQATCFCTQFRGNAYSAIHPAVTACDAREDAIKAELDKDKLKND